MFAIPCCLSGFSRLLPHRIYGGLHPCALHRRYGWPHGWGLRFTYPPCPLPPLPLYPLGSYGPELLFARPLWTGPLWARPIWAGPLWPLGNLVFVSFGPGPQAIKVSPTYMIHIYIHVYIEVYVYINMYIHMCACSSSSSGFCFLLAKVAPRDDVSPAHLVFPILEIGHSFQTWHTRGFHKLLCSPYAAYIMYIAYIYISISIYNWDHGGQGTAAPEWAICRCRFILAAFL